MMSALRTFMVPRATCDRLTTTVFVTMRHVFDLVQRALRSDAARERLPAFFAPVSLLTLPMV